MRDSHLHCVERERGKARRNLAKIHAKARLEFRKFLAFHPVARPLEKKALLLGARRSTLLIPQTPKTSNFLWQDKHKPKQRAGTSLPLAKIQPVKQDLPGSPTFPITLPRNCSTKQNLNKNEAHLKFLS